jgi:hypothetical protein
LARHVAPQSRQLQIYLPKFFISNKQRHALAFGGFSFAGLDPIAHDLLPLTKRAAVGIVPPGAKRLVMGWRQKFLNAHPSALPALIVKRRQRRRNPIHFMQFSPQQIQVTDLKGLSDLHGLEELFRCVGAPALSIQCCDPRVLCGNSLLPRRNEHLGPKNHFF